MTLKPKIITGKFPHFWDRGVIFFANLQSLFFGNEDQTKVLREEVGGITSYGGRLLPIINLLFRKDQNLIFLETFPNEDLLEYITNRLDITLPEIEILPHKEYTFLKEQIQRNDLEKIEPFINKIRTYQAEWLDGFVTDSTLSTIAQHTGKSTVSSIEGSKKGNNKFLLHHYLLEKDLPVFDTFEASSPSDVISCIEKLQNKGYKKAVLKSQIGASGCGLAKYDINVAVKCKEFPEYLFFEGPCLVQGWLDEDIIGVKHLGSPSVQMFLSETELYLFDITEQLLKDQSIHEGNISPPPYIKRLPNVKEELLFQAAEAGSWLHAQGYRGTASIDFLAIYKSEAVEVIICEINARITGATYPAVLARHFLPSGAWLMRNIRFSTPLKGSQVLSELDRSGLLYNRDMDKGVLPFNFNEDVYGNVYKGQFIFLASKPDECTNLLKQVQTIFLLTSKFDRD